MVKSILHLLLTLGIESARVENETGRTFTLSFVCTRDVYETLESALPERWELRGIERLDRGGRGEASGHDTYRYTVLFFKF